MLVATRDSLPHPGAQDAPLPGRTLARETGRVTRVARFMTVLQMAGSLLAIPVGLASGYSIYRANFSVETSCQSLRASIIGMIDKQIDAGTRRMLVGRDVETFEKTCGAVDPEAVAAFKRLLAVEQAPAAAHAAAPAKDAARKVEPRPAVTAKPAPAPIPVPVPAPAATAPTAAAAEPVQQRAAPVSDAKWLAAVRGALVSHGPEHGRPLAATTPSTEPAAIASTRVSAPPPAPLGAPVPQAVAAPTLPPATEVVTVPAQPAAADHPVPPAAIPETVASVNRTGWLGHIPFIGQTLAR